MDRTSVIILAICFVLLFSWGKISRTLWPPQPAPPQTAQPTNEVSSASGTNAPADAAESPEATPAAPAPAPAVVEAATARGPEVFETLENEKAVYTFTSHGGGIKTIALKDYPAIADAKKAAKLGDTRQATINVNAPMPIMAIRGSPAIEGVNEYALRKSGESVIAETSLTNGLRIVKEFNLSATNYLIAAAVRFENATDKPLSLPEQEIVMGTAAPASPGEDPRFQGGLWSNGEDSKTIEAPYFANKTLGCLGSNPRHYYTLSDPELKWAAGYSQFFATVAVPETTPKQHVLASVSTPPLREEPDADPGSSIWTFAKADFVGINSVLYRVAQPAQPFFENLFKRLSTQTQGQLKTYDGRSQPPMELVEGFIADLNALLPTAPLYEEDKLFFANVADSGELRMLAERNPVGEERARFNRILIEAAFGPKLVRESPKGYQSSFVYGSTILQPGQTNTLAFEFYTGPKEYYTLSKLSEERDSDIDKVMNLSGFFGLFSKMLLLSMTGLHNLGLSYGLCIVAITIIIKLLFWPLTQSSTRSMKRMSKLQPQMKEIQEKYKDDPQKAQMKIMEFMRANKVNPLASCLPILVQFPFFIGFFKMIKTAIELRGASFLWAADLSSPDTIFFLPGLGWIPFLGIPGEGLPINPMPIMMGVSMVYQMRLTPQSPTMDPVQQKMFKYMPIFFMFILYGYSSGLTLYWTVNNILSIIQTKLVRSREGEDDPIIMPSGTASSSGATIAAEGGTTPKGGKSVRKGMPGMKKKKKNRNDPFDPNNRR